MLPEIKDPDTIAAPITAPGRAAVAIVRISGPRVLEVLSLVCGNVKKILGKPRELVNSPIFVVDAKGQKQLLDHALVVYFPEPNSFTGEHCAEINLHGSTFLVQKLMEYLATLDVNLARPGEFSERAFHNGKFDLTQVEAISDLISAESDAQAKAAREQLEGRLAGALTKLGEPLRNLLAEIEAALDFPEEDISPWSQKKWQEELSAIRQVLVDYISSYRTGRILREGALVPIVGLPNAGKSQLLNAMLKEERVIVTPTPGTTRDSIEERLNINDIHVRIVDTAGLAGDWQNARTPDEIEQKGIDYSWRRIEQADLVIFLFDSSIDVECQKSVFEKVKHTAKRLLTVANKQDLLEDNAKWSKPSFVDNCLHISALNEVGVDNLKKEIYKTIIGEESSRQFLIITTARHVEALKKSLDALIKAQEDIEKQIPAEFVSADIRNALGNLEEIIGVTANEDILGRIFSKFCIGK